MFWIILEHKTGKAGDKDAKRAKENSTCWKRKYQIWSGIFDPADPAGDFLAMNVCIGTVNIPVAEIPKILSGHGADETFSDIVMGIRFPRALAAAILGGALALSGYLLQTFFHNPIASPFTLGISSGAKLVVALIMVASLGYMPGV